MENKKISQLDPYSGSPDSFDIPGVADGQTLKTNLGAAILQKALNERLLRPSDLKTVNGVPLTGPGDVALDVANPFKGRFPAGTTETENLPTGSGVPRVGDFAYVDTVDGNDEPVLKVYDCVVDGVWHDSGRTADPANVNTFADGQQLGLVHINQDINAGGQNNVPSAEAVKGLRNEMLDVLSEHVEIDLSDPQAATTVAGWLVGYSTKNWVSGNHASYLIPVTPGQRLTVEKTTAGTAMFAFLLSLPDFETLANNTPASLATTSFGAQRNANFFFLNSQNIPQTSETGTVPPGCSWLWVLKTYSGENRKPTKVEVERMRDLDMQFGSGQRLGDVSLTDDATGASSMAVVSQKGLHDVLSCRVPVDLYGEEVFVMNRVPSSQNGGSFFREKAYAADRYESRLIPVAPGQEFYIQWANIGRYAQYALIKEMTLEELEGLRNNSSNNYAGSNLFVADGPVSVADETLVTIPEGCGYLCIYWKTFDSVNGLTFRRPREVSEVRTVTMADVQKMVSEGAGGTKVVFNGLRLIRAIVSRNNNWYNKENTATDKYLNMSYILPVVPGQVFEIEAAPGKTAFWSYLKSVPAENIFDAHDGIPADVVEGTERVTCREGDGVVRFVIPDTCNYLVVMWISGTNSDATPKTLRRVEANGTPAGDEGEGAESDSLNHHNEFIRSGDVGLTESNPVPLVNEKVYGCSGDAADEVKHVDCDGYFGPATRMLVKMAHGNSHSSPKITVGASTAEYPVWYNGHPADESNTWFDGELVWLQFDGSAIVLSKFDDTQIEGTDSVAVKNISVQQRNVMRLADRYRFVKWTPKVNTTVDGFKVGIPRHNHAKTITWRDTVEQPYGIPYSSATQDQKYVGLNVSLYTFLSAVNNPYSLLYTETIKSGTGSRSAWNRHYTADNASAYYGLVCCAFTAATTGCMRNWNNGYFQPVAEQGYEFVIVNYNETITAESIRVGDVFNTGEGYSGHSVVVYQLFQDVFTGKITHVRYAESTSGGGLTPDPIFGCRFCLMGIDDFVNVYMKGYDYIHYRYIKLYQNNLKNMADGGNNPMLEESLPTDPVDIKLNYSHVATDVIRPGRSGDDGSHDTASQGAGWTFNNEICTIGGDKVSFPIGLFSIGNIIALNYNLDGSSLGSYNCIHVYRRSHGTEEYTFDKSYPLSDDDVINDYLKGHTVVLPRPEDSSYVGEYYACLADERNNVESAHKTYWEVIDNPTTITEEPNGDYIVEWTRQAVVLGVSKKCDAVSPDPDPYFDGLGPVYGKNVLISLSTEEIRTKRYRLEAWRLKGVDKSKVYVRLLTVGIYGITGVYVKLTPEE